MSNDFEDDSFDDDQPWSGAIEDIDRLLSLIDDLEDSYSDVYERGEDFLADVYERASEVRKTILQNQRVTPRQEKAIENWTEGVEKWHPEHKD